MEPQLHQPQNENLPRWHPRCDGEGWWRGAPGLEIVAAVAVQRFHGEPSTNTRRSTSLLTLIFKKRYCKNYFMPKLSVPLTRPLSRIPKFRTHGTDQAASVKSVDFKVESLKLIFEIGAGVPGRGAIAGSLEEGGAAHSPAARFSAQTVPGCERRKSPWRPGAPSRSGCPWEVARA